MRVLVLSQSFAPVFEGGTERVARTQARALRDLGHEVRVIGAAPSEHVGHYVVDDLPVELVLEDFPAGDLDALLAQRLWLERPTRRAAVLALADAHGPFDLVHVQHLASLSLGLVPAFKARGARVIISLHDLFATCARFFRDPPAGSGVTCPTRAQGFGACAVCLGPEAPEVAHADLAAAVGERDRRFRAELAAADALVAPSQSHARRVEALLDLAPQAVAVVPNGLVSALQMPTAPAPDGPLTLLHFGHRVRTKGVVELVRAVEAAARTTGQRLRLVLLGAELEPGLDAELRALSSAADLELHGAYDMDELAAAAARAHVAAFPSKALESYGLVVDEALALGLPVLVADTGDGQTPGALAERVGAAGQVLPRPLSDAAVGAWAAAIARLAEETARAPKGGRLDGWRAAIPTRMPGPADAAAHLLSLLPPERT